MVVRRHTLRVEPLILEDQGAAGLTYPRGLLAIADEVIDECMFG
jgi:hypothetical protein